MIKPRYIRGFVFLKECVQPHLRAVITEINNWINQGGSYKAGLDLLQLLVDDKRISGFVYRLCVSGESNFTRKKMREELEKYLRDVESGQIQNLRKRVVPKSNSLPEKKDSPGRPRKKMIDPSSLPDDLQKDDRRVRDLYAENRVIKGRLITLCYEPSGEIRSLRRMAHSKSERMALALTSARNQKEISALLARIEYYTEHGVRMPGTSPEEERRKVAKWLNEQPQYINYIRQADSLFKKKGMYHDKERYDRYKSELSLIQEYVDQWL